MAKNLHPAAELAAHKIGKIKAGGQDDKYLRLAAEYDNYRKRTSRQFAEIVKNANEELILELLAVLDDFSRALQALSAENGENQPATAESVLSGMRLIYDKMTSVFKGRGVNRFDPLDQPFDPQYHDAVMQMPSDKEEGTIVSVISPGYMINDRVIRHAKVVVASSK